MDHPMCLSSPDPNCRYCKGTGTIQLLTSAVDCEECRIWQSAQSPIDYSGTILDPDPANGTISMAPLNNRPIDFIGEYEDQCCTAMLTYHTPIMDQNGNVIDYRVEQHEIPMTYRCAVLRTKDGKPLPMASLCPWRNQVSRCQH